MLPATQKHLEDLKAAGFDVSSLEEQVKNPILEKQADRLIGGGILRQQEFSQYYTKSEEEKKALKKQVTDLAALHDSADSLKGNDAVYQEAIKVIATQEAALIESGWDEEEVRALSLKATPGLLEKINNPTTKTKTETLTKENEEDMSKVDLSKYIDTDTFQAAAANQIYGSVALNAKVQAAMLRAEKLGIELNEENINKIAENIRTTVESGGTIDQAIDKTFGLSEREKVLAEEKQKKDIENARAEGKAEGLKEAGVPRRTVSTEVHPLSKVSHVRVTEPEKVDVANVPTNKFGDAEVYKTRNLQRDYNSRIARAEQFHEQVLARESNQVSAE